MQSLPKKHLLEWPPNILEDLRKIHNLYPPNRIEEAVTILEEWIQKQDHFLKKDFSKEYLERCLIVNKGSVEKTKRQIDKLCTLKTLLPQFFKVHNVKDLKDFMNVGWLVPLPKMTDEFYRIYLIKLNGNLLTDKTIMEYCHMNICVCEYLKAHDYPNGFIIMYDFQKTNFSNLLSKINPVMFQQFLNVIVDGYGARLKGIHMLTESTSVDLVVKMAKQFLSKKISDRIFVHKTLEDLYTVIPKELLPKDYNGSERSVEKLGEEWTEELSSKVHVEYVEMMSSACTDEKLRRTDQFNEEYMGMPGSFRNLKVD